MLEGAFLEVEGGLPEPLDQVQTSLPEALRCFMSFTVFFFLFGVKLGRLRGIWRTLENL